MFFKQIFILKISLLSTNRLFPVVPRTQFHNNLKELNGILSWIFVKRAKSCLCRIYIDFRIMISGPEKGPIHWFVWINSFISMSKNRKNLSKLKYKGFSFIIIIYSPSYSLRDAIHRDYACPTHLSTVPSFDHVAISSHSMTSCVSISNCFLAIRLLLYSARYPISHVLCFTLVLIIGKS